MELRLFRFNSDLEGWQSRRVVVSSALP
jgi:hypothetical protein